FHYIEKSDQVAVDIKLEKYSQTVSQISGQHLTT
ncbi:unnamed protein product, partial [Brassica rapa]